MMPPFTKVGLDALLTPENCAVLLIDHQPSQLANVNSHDPTLVINNVTALAKTAKAYGVPTILTTINAKRGGEIFKQIQAVFPDQKPIDRSFINSWEDRRVVEAVKNTGRKKKGIDMATIARCLIAFFFVESGSGKIFAFRQSSTILASISFPIPTFFLTAI